MRRYLTAAVVLWAVLPHLFPVYLKVLEDGRARPGGKEYTREETAHHSYLLLIDRLRAAGWIY